MNGAPQVPHIERLAFFNGQRLFAEDLQTLDGFNRHMRWLHNRSLHDFGIGSGFIVRGERGDREVNIAPGYAVDNEGREIILLLPHVEPVPPIADDGFGKPKFYDLTVHYPRTEDLEELETRGGICNTHGVVRRQEEPVFCWIELGGTVTPQNLKPTTQNTSNTKIFPPSDGQFRPKNPKHAEQIANGEKIVLARISVKNCKLETLSIATRRNIKPERLPYVACGRTPEGTTIWNVRALVRSSDTAVFIIAETIVNTSVAKFASTPGYNARVAGHRLFRLDHTGITPDEINPTFILEGFTNILSNATSTEFTLRVTLPVSVESLSSLIGPVINLFGLDINPGSVVDRTVGGFLSSTARWHIEWMGVEG